MTQKAKVLAHLKRGQSITPIEALNLYGVFRLSDVVWKLKNEGHLIITTSVKNQNGNDYAKYIYNGRGG